MEIGQVFLLVLLIPALKLTFRYVVPERIGTIIISVFVAHTAWHWMLERGEQLARFPLPAFNAATAASVLRWLMGLLALGGLVWLVSVIRTHRAQRKPSSAETDRIISS